MTDAKSDCLKHRCHARLNVALVTCQRDEMRLLRLCNALQMASRRLAITNDLHANVCRDFEKIYINNELTS